MGAVLYKMKHLIYIGIVFILVGVACRKGPTGADVIPNVPVSLTVNLDLPKYFDLAITGTWMYFPDGYKGLILYHAYDNEYYAFDRACSYQPQNTCSQLWMDSTTKIYMFCGEYINGEYKKCCDSRFEIPGGFPVQAPASQPMRMYNITRSGNTLYIGN